MGQPKKNNPRILADDIYSYISTNSSLTRIQVRECFDVYYDMIFNLLSSNYRTNDLTIAFPKLGLFYFKELKGRKKGSTYKMPIGSNGEIRTIVVEEDEPNTIRMKFRLSQKLSNILKTVGRTNANTK